ncbi:hypothetical protein POSPLADRAFT_1067262 [Postia placenta MAD-698-R-SB12]|uniref:Uncharacterized protein n=1 Tax=Postia placenta MAD-698-R-SB12 TaxID=670580 RepID=A0A1X6MT64_9APHY|nr:hypothetical protein POSPLADRAFT_1067262 [Postia placenta MAD-698-R-SB12]OSX59568.1 hypothetical protein POSPLADRAFT_1067262 [Postia placenta MAD-698-R-SB12]
MSGVPVIRCRRKRIGPAWLGICDRYAAAYAPTYARQTTHPTCILESAIRWEESISIYLFESRLGS